MGAADLPPLAEFMPHRAPMLLLDRMLAWSEEAAVCERTVRPGDSFVEEDGVSALLALELFAQAAAAHVGYLGRTRGDTMGSGALLGTRRIDLAVDRFAPGDVLEVHVRQLMSIPPLAQYECALRRRGETVASGTVNVAMGAGEAR